MEKLSEINLGKGGWVIKFGTIFIILIMGVILYTGIYKIKLPQYANVEIVSTGRNFFLISTYNLQKSEEIMLGNKTKPITLSLQKIAPNKYRIAQNDLSNRLAQNLKDNIITQGKTLLYKENLFESLLPFW